jgi:hypothetical protein
MRHYLQYHRDGVLPLCCWPGMTRLKRRKCPEDLSIGNPIKDIDSSGLGMEPQF